MVSFASVSRLFRVGNRHACSLLRRFCVAFMKNKKLLLIIIGVLAAVCLISAVIYKKYKKPEIKIDLTCENIIPSSPSVLVRLDNLGSVWADFKGTNFYYQLNSFLRWLLEKTPSGFLGYSNDVRDIQESIGFKLDEKNILEFLGKKLLIALWLENIDDRKVLIISNLENDSALSEVFKKQTTQKAGVDEHRDTAICLFGKHRYWCLLNDKLVISNDIGTVRKVIDLSSYMNEVMGDAPDKSVAADPGFRKSISRITSKNYIYIKPSRIKLDKYQLIEKEIDDTIISVGFDGGIILKSYISPPESAKYKKPKKIESLFFAPGDVSFYSAGNFSLPRFISNTVFDKVVLGDESGYLFWPKKFMLYCEVKNKKIFLSKFEETVRPVSKDPEGGIFLYKVPYLGSRWKYFFAEDRFIVCTPAEFSAEIKKFITERKKLLSETESFKRFKIPHKNNGIFYINLSDICRTLFGKDYLKFILPAGGYTVWTSAGPESVYHIPMVDLSREQWAELFSVLRNFVSKKTAEENEKITRGHLIELRESLDIYNTKANKYPVKLNSLIDEYLDEIPRELLTKSNNVSDEMNGSGGWFYNAGRVGVNVFGKDSSGMYYTQW